jgi:hypothetical protein
MRPGEGESRACPAVQECLGPGQLRDKTRLHIPELHKELRMDEPARRGRRQGQLLGARRGLEKGRRAHRGGARIHGQLRDTQLRLCVRG